MKDWEDTGMVKRKEVHYCAFDHFYHKPTHIWTNMEWTPRGTTGSGLWPCAITGAGRAAVFDGTPLARDEGSASVANALRLQHAMVIGSSSRSQRNVALHRSTLAFAIARCAALPAGVASDGCRFSHRAAEGDISV